MATVTPQQTRACYVAALSVLRGDMRRSDAIRSVAETSGMKENPAGITIDTLRRLLQNQVYKLPLGTAQTRDVLTWITADFGADVSRSCAQTVLDHVAATEGPPLRNGPQHSVRAAVLDFLAGLSQPTLASVQAAETAAVNAKPHGATHSGPPMKYLCLALLLATPAAADCVTAADLATGITFTRKDGRHGLALTEGRNIRINHSTNNDD